ncbi:histidinol-phosphatase HisJ family protein [Lachnospiraceae bacterium OttesenSCG-928-D06]|nr:histidinol-phosphatase HisJ family protein [Lachnospiraceae bacterium OttesenSCG-928-D06]
MSIKADYHLHSSFSTDSTASMESMIQQGIELGLTHMCFTEHNDFDYPENENLPENAFLLSTKSYYETYLGLREKYADKIQVQFGVELGLQPYLAERHSIYTKSYPFDFIIGSSHLCDGKDPYYPSFYQDITEEEAYGSYFQSIINNIKAFTDFDVYGHLDYIVRYGPNADHNYSYEKYKDLFDTILKLLIHNGKGIELNTGGVKNGLLELHPCNGVLKRYKELGGEIITVGSDAHMPAQLTDSFKRAEDVLLDCGFHYYTIFKNREKTFIKL